MSYFQNLPKKSDAQLDLGFDLIDISTPKVVFNLPQPASNPLDDLFGSEPASTKIMFDPGYLNNLPQSKSTPPQPDAEILDFFSF